MQAKKYTTLVRKTLLSKDLFFRGRWKLPELLGSLGRVFILNYFCCISCDRWAAMWLKLPSSNAQLISGKIWKLRIPYSIPKCCQYVPNHIVLQTPYNWKESETQKLSKQFLMTWMFVYIAGWSTFTWFFMKFIEVYSIEKPELNATQEGNLVSFTGIR